MPRGPSNLNKLYGFNHGPPFPQLARLLGIIRNPGTMRVLKKRLQELSLEYLDVNQKGNDQGVALELIEQCVLNQYPELFSRGLKVFDTKKRLHFVRKVICQIHNNRRWATKHKLEKMQGRSGLQCVNHSPEPRNKSDVIELFDSDSESCISNPTDQSEMCELDQEEHQDVVIAGRPKGSKFMVTERHGDRKINWEARPPCRHPPPPELSSSYKTLPAYFNSTNRTPSGQLPASPSSFERPHAVQRRETKYPESRATTYRPFDSKDERVTTPTSTSPVHSFFATPRPSELSVATNFENYGCATDDYLRKLAAFPPERRMQVLREILAGRLEGGQTRSQVDKARGDRRLKQMDLVVLDDDLVTYFNTNPHTCAF